MKDRLDTGSPSPEIDPGALTRLIGAVGDNCFGTELLGFLNDTCVAEHCAIFRYSAECPVELAAVSLDGSDTAHRQISLYLANQYWRHDPAISVVQTTLRPGESSMMCFDVNSLMHAGLREVVYGRTNIHERVLLWGGAPGMTIGLSILKSKARGEFSREEITRLGGLANMLVALTTKHAGLVRQRSELTLALTSLPDIEQCIASAPEELPRREAQVCALILYGVSSTGIALELGIGEETVMTYRKRAYQRLGIGSQRELLLWYIAQWSDARTAMYSASSARLH